MEAKIDAIEARNDHKLYQIQQMAAGSALVIIDDMTKFTLMKARLKVFAACVRGGQGKGFDKGKKLIKTSAY